MQGHVGNTGKKPLIMSFQFFNKNTYDENQSFLIPGEMICCISWVPPVLTSY